jgi:hypothetical protein
MGQKDPPDDSGGRFKSSTSGGMSFDTSRVLKNDTAGKN